MPPAENSQSTTPTTCRATRRQDFARRAILWSSLAVFIAALAIAPVSLPLAIVVLVGTHFFFFFASLCPNSRLCVPVVTRFDTREREVWLTFDDGPDPQETPRVLGLLAQHRALATFFLIGRAAEKNPGLVREILAGGHRIANHTYTHQAVLFWAYPPSRFAREIDRCTDVLAAIAGSPPRFFRGPVGWHPPLLYQVLCRRELQPIGWTARGLDYGDHNPSRVAGRLLRHLRPGAIFMLHPECRNRRGENTSLAALEIVLREIDRAGYRCVLPEADQLV
ncbi:MAG TPA: polysaccharide deacetylase family protein [Opitutaceae bacterium]|jgi:peptidoglycan/xylan/chitin deacetylase (PgdA/CDA1 family)|nr:polysaccharide deacetylase family protein [Opitutaceae bacterium]